METKRNDQQSEFLLSQTLRLALFSFSIRIPVSWTRICALRFQKRNLVTQLSQLHWTPFFKRINCIETNFSAILAVKMPAAKACNKFFHSLQRCFRYVPKWCFVLTNWLLVATSKSDRRFLRSPISRLTFPLAYMLSESEDEFFKQSSFSDFPQSKKVPWWMF